MSAKCEKGYLRAVAQQVMLLRAQPIAVELTRNVNKTASAS